MDEKQIIAEPLKPRPFQFRLRTLLIGMAALCLLFAQSPLVEWEPPQFDTASTVAYGAGGFYTSERTVQIADGYHFIPMRAWAVASIEVAALIGWLAWRRLGRPATKS